MEEGGGSWRGTREGPSVRLGGDGDVEVLNSYLRAAAGQLVPLTPSMLQGVLLAVGVHVVAEVWLAV